MVLPVIGRSFLQARHPVLDHVQRVTETDSARIAGYHGEKTLAVRRNVIQKTAAHEQRSEQWLRLSDFDGSSFCIDFDRCERAIGRHVEEFLSVAAPPRQNAAGGRDLALPPGTLEWSHVDFIPPRF